jgi:serine/threonine-protein kinase HipA
MPVGELLWIGSQGVAALQWDERAISMRPGLSPIVMTPSREIAIAARTPFEGLHSLFSDSIPDGFGLRLMNKGLLDSGLTLAQINPLHRLAWVGRRGIGALIYEPIIEGSDRMLVELSEAARLAAVAETQDFSDIPVQAIRAGGSALGARPKFWAAMDLGAVPSPSFSRSSSTRLILGSDVQVEGFSQVLLKFAPTRGDQNEPFYEAACLELATKNDVPAAKGHILFHKAGAALAVERFDRDARGGRTHVQSVAALLNADFRTPGVVDYISIVTLARRLGNFKNQDRGQELVERLYRQVCLNVCLHIRDDHIKNLSFCMDHSGKWSLSPAYDLCPTIGCGLTGEHTTTINGKGTGFTRDDLLRFASMAGVSEDVAVNGIDRAREAASQFPDLAIAKGATRKGVTEWAKRMRSCANALAPITSSSTLGNVFEKIKKPHNSTMRRKGRGID